MSGDTRLAATVQARDNPFLCFCLLHPINQRVLLHESSSNRLSSSCVDRIVAAEASTWTFLQLLLTCLTSTALWFGKAVHGWSVSSFGFRREEELHSRRRTAPQTSCHHTAHPGSPWTWTTANLKASRGIRWTCQKSWKLGLTRACPRLHSEAGGAAAGTAMDPPTRTSTTVSAGAGACRPADRA